MSDAPLLERYKADVSGTETVDGRKCYVLTLTAIKEDVNYYSQKMWVDVERDTFRLKLIYLPKVVSC